MAPPSVVAEFPENVVLVMSLAAKGPGGALLEIAPPKPAEFPRNVLSLIVSAPASAIAPPFPLPAFPCASVRLSSPRWAATAKSRTVFPPSKVIGAVEPLASRLTYFPMTMVLVKGMVVGVGQTWVSFQASGAAGLEFQRSVVVDQAI